MNETNLSGDWDFESGILPADFANTMECHASPQPQERLKRYSDLVGWSWAADLLTEEEAQYLLAEAEAHPDEASAALKKAIELRETIYRILSAVAKQKTPTRKVVNHLNHALSEAFVQSQIVPPTNGFEWNWVAAKGSYDRMLWPISRSMADLLTSEDLDRIGECADDQGCGWLFYDTSRNRSRRWCSMESCGNRAKARRHYRRKTQKLTK